MGYTSFLGQLFDEAEESTPQKHTASLLFKYETNMTLFTVRIDAAVAEAKKQTNPERIAMTGYCFGGTAVTAYATLGNADKMGVNGTWAFHGRVTGFAGSINGMSDDMMLSSANVWTPKESFIFSPKCSMVMTAGTADPLMNETDMKTFLKFAGNKTAKWTYQLYGGAHHSFTLPGDMQMKMSRGNITKPQDSPSYPYDVVANEKSMNTMNTWLVNFLGFVPHNKTKESVTLETGYVSYKDGDVEMSAYVAKPKGANNLQAIIFAHAGDGVDAAIEEWVNRSAMAGYWAMGAGAWTKAESAAFNSAAPAAKQGIQVKNLNTYYSNMTLFVSRMSAAVGYAKTQNDVIDTQKIGAAGFCFGGTQVLQYAKAGQAEKDDVKAVVSFHGGLDSASSPAFTALGIKYSVLTNDPKPENYCGTRVSILNGEKDTTIPSADIEKIQGQLATSKTFWDSVLYGNQTHAWSLPSSQGQLVYSPQYSQRAFDSMIGTMTSAFESHGRPSPSICSGASDFDDNTSDFDDNTGDVSDAAMSSFAVSFLTVSVLAVIAMTL